MEMEIDKAAENGNPSSSVGKTKVKSNKVKEGSFLLGSPTFIDLGGGLWRCEETGHDLPEKEKESYARSKACRITLIDAALNKKNPLLNAFQLHPLFKSKLVCSLTGDVINKLEEHIWKHINGKRFLKKLGEKEVEMVPSPEKIENSKRARKKAKLNTFSIQKNMIEADENGSLAREPATVSSDAEEPDFWCPPIGERWDFDDGRERWQFCNTVDEETKGMNYHDYFDSTTATVLEMFDEETPIIHELINAMDEDLPQSDDEDANQFENIIGNTPVGTRAAGEQQLRNRNMEQLCAKQGGRTRRHGQGRG